MEQRANRIEPDLAAGEDIHTGGATGPDVLLDEAAALAAHPAFESAVRTYTAGLVRFRESSRLINKLSAHEARFRTVGYLLHLSAVDRTQGGDGAVRYGTLAELCVTRRGEVSARVLKTMLALMRLAGFVEMRRGIADRRITFYRPTGRMLDFARLWFRHAAEALDEIEPARRRSARLAHDQAFLDRLLVEAGSDHAAAPPAERLPEFIDFFGGREGAAAIVARLAQREMHGIAVESRAALARRFALSKTQVNDVIADGVRRGLLSSGDGSIPLLTERFRDLYRRWIAIELAFYARHM
jgi:hypothetical protein